MGLDGYVVNNHGDRKSLSQGVHSLPLVKWPKKTAKINGGYSDPNYVSKSRDDPPSRGSRWGLEIFASIF